MALTELATYIPPQIEEFDDVFHDSPSMDTDGTYIYASVSNGIIRKIRCSDLIRIAEYNIYTLPHTQVIPNGVIYGAGFAYVFYTFTDNAAYHGGIAKINASDMSLVSVWEGTDNVFIYNSYPAWDGIYLYFGTRKTSGALPGRVIQINPATMAATGLVWSNNYCPDTVGTCFGGYVYYPCRNSVGGAYAAFKIDPTTMLTVLTFTPAHPGSDSFTGSSNDGSYLYLSYQQAAPFPFTKNLVKVDPATMLQVGIITDVDVAYVGPWDGTNLYTSSSASPYKVSKIDVTLMAIVGFWQDDGTMGTSPKVIYTGGFLYAGSGASFYSPGRLVMIETSAMAEVLRLIGYYDKQNPYSIATDGTHVYIGYYRDFCLVGKNRASDMAAVGQWVVDDIFTPYNNLQALVCLGDYVYAGVSNTTSTQAKVLQIRKSDMTLVAEWDSATEKEVKSLSTDGIFIYAGTSKSGSVAKVFKIVPATMTDVAAWSGTDIARPMGLLNYGGKLFVGLDTSPAKVYKVNTNTMLTDSLWIGNTGENWANSVVSDGRYLYVALYMAVGTVIKIDMATMTKVATWTGTTNEQWAYSVAVNRTQLFASFQGSSHQLALIKPSSMTTVEAYGDSDFPIGYGMVLGSLFVNFTDNYTNKTSKFPAGAKRYLGNILVDQLIYQHAERMQR